LQKTVHLLITAEASSAANTNYCVSKYLTQAGVKNTWINLGRDAGIHGNGHMMMWEKNNLENRGIPWPLARGDIETGDE